MWSLLSGLLVGISFLAEPLLFLLHFVRIGFYSIQNDEDKIKKIFRYLDKTTISTRTSFQHGKVYPAGSFIGWGCFGYYSMGDRTDGISSSIHILTTRPLFDRLVANDEIILSAPNATSHVVKEKETITLYGRTGNYMSIYYTRRTLEVSDLVARGDQIRILSDITSIFEKKGRATVFLHGICGAGKSTIGLLLAKELKGSFCHTFNPTNPGDSLHNLVREAEVEYDEKKPLVIVIEEVNTLIRQVHANEITLHKNVQTSVYNKSTYNTFMDDMALYKNVVLILTSNESVEEVNAIDPCYLRTGRVDAWYSMMNEIDHEKVL
jgi:hypothetical protein